MPLSITLRKTLCRQQGKYIFMGKSFLWRYFADSFLVIVFKQEKVWGQILYKIQVFLAASNFLKSAFEHNTAEYLVPMAGKNKYTWGKVILRDTLLFIQTGKSIGITSLYNTWYFAKTMKKVRFLTKNWLRIKTFFSLLKQKYCRRKFLVGWK